MIRYAVSTRPLGVVDGEFEDPCFEGCMATFNSLTEAQRVARSWPYKQFAVYKLDIQMSLIHWEDVIDGTKQEEIEEDVPL